MTSLDQIFLGTSYTNVRYFCLCFVQKGVCKTLNQSEFVFAVPVSSRSGAGVIVSDVLG